MKPTPKQPEFDFTATLPPDRQFFTLQELAKHWRISHRHVENLIDTGQLRTGLDVGNFKTKTKRAMLRIPRAIVIEFMKSRTTTPNI